MGKVPVQTTAMGFSNSLENFQEKMNFIFRGFEFIQAYIDDLFTINKGDWYDHLNKLELTPQNIKYNGIKFNVKKSFLGKTDMDYLGFWVIWTWIRSINRKEESITNMNLQKNKK